MCLKMKCRKNIVIVHTVERKKAEAGTYRALILIDFVASHMQLLFFLEKLFTDIFKTPVYTCSFACMYLFAFPSHIRFSNNKPTPLHK